MSSSRPASTTPRHLAEYAGHRPTTRLSLEVGAEYLRRRPPVRPTHSSMMTPDLHLMIDATRISIRLLPGLLLLVHVGTAGPASAQTAVPDEVEGRPCSMVRPLWHGDV